MIINGPGFRAYRRGAVLQGQPKDRSPTPGKPVEIDVFVIQPVKNGFSAVRKLNPVNARNRAVEFFFKDKRFNGIRPTILAGQECQTFIDNDQSTALKKNGLQK